MEALTRRIEEQHILITKIRSEISKVLVGQEDLIEGLLIGLLTKGHILIEGVPGLAKTSAVKALADTVQAGFKRIQFTPDLLPADLIGTEVYRPKTGDFVIKKGPLFNHIILADEINRAPSKVQSALLEAMQEHSVTVAKATRRLPEPFFVLATQNPLEMEGTYPLPEAQLDRFFFKLDVPFPSVDELVEIANRTTVREMPQAEAVASSEQIVAMQNLARGVPIASHVTAYAAGLLKATHPGEPEAPESVNQFVRFGASPRGMQAMILGGKIFALLDGRYNVAYDDLRQAALPALRHRLILNFEAQAEGVTTDDVIQALLAAIVPEAV